MKMAKRSTGNNRTDQWQTLVYLCKLVLSEHFESAADSPDWQSVNWENVLSLAGQHRVRPIINMGINLVKSKARIPDEIIVKLQEYHSQRGHENLLHARELIHLIKAMREKGVEVIPYKGAVLAQCAYNDIGSREMSDIDFLMKLEEFPLVRDILLEKGYVPSKNVPEEFEPLFFRQNFQYNFDLYQGSRRLFHVEPHWKIGLRQWQTDLEFAAIKPFTSKKHFYGTEINMLTPEGLLITTCLHHGGEDRWKSLKYICDVAAILFRFEKELNWELLLNETRRIKVINLILMGVGLAVTTFNAPVPKHVGQLTTKEKIATHVTKANDQLKSGNRQASVDSYLKHVKFHFSLRKSPITKLKVLYYHFIRIFTPTIYDINDERTAGKKYWWLFVTKPFRIWRMHVKSR
ncbi:MAG: hypothetical protein Roseis2KO_05460 [Roseivirga sp.]